MFEVFVCRDQVDRPRDYQKQKCQIVYSRREEEEDWSQAFGNYGAALDELSPEARKRVEKLVHSEQDQSDEVNDHENRGSWRKRTVFDAEEQNSCAFLNEKEEPSAAAEDDLVDHPIRDSC